jgi:hypothetical protein
MKKSDVLRAARECLRILNEKYPDIEPVEMSTDWKSKKYVPIHIRIAHYKYVSMHLETFDFNDRSKREKMMRWLAWAQGVIYENLLPALEDQKSTNRPESDSR